MEQQGSKGSDESALVEVIVLFCWRILHYIPGWSTSKLCRLRILMRHSVDVNEASESALPLKNAISSNFDRRSIADFSWNVL